MSYSVGSYNGVTVQEVIKTARLRSGFTQQEMASILGCSPRAYTSWERGDREPSITVFMKILEIGGISLADAFNADAVQAPLDEATVLVRKYMSLDDDGRRFVDMIVDRELKWEGVTNKNGEQD